MAYTTFRKEKNNALLEPMFLGNSVNVARFDQQRHPIFEKLMEKQLSFFWRPEEVDVSKDAIDFKSLSEAEQHIFSSNLKYQTLLDSIQGRAPNVAFLPIASTSEIENWVILWSFIESLHSRSYTHILRNIYTDPSVIFDGIVENEEILKRAADITSYYDDLISYVNLYTQFGEGTHSINGATISIDLYTLKTKLYLCIMSVNALEAIRFYVSFACSFAFAERELMEGNAKIIKLIARDESLHLSGTQHILYLLSSGKDDPDFVQIAVDCKVECEQIFRSVAEQEKEWAKYLFKDGFMLGLNKEILCTYIEFITNIRMSAVGFEPIFESHSNPIPWINSWLSSDNVQVAPQEVEISSYLVGQIDSVVNPDDLDGFEL